MGAPIADDLFSHFAEVAGRRRVHAALAAGDAAESVWSYERLFGAARRLAIGLRRRGLRPGDRVAVMAGTSAELVVVLLALLRTGAALLPVNVAYRRRELAHLLVDAEPRLVIAGRHELRLLAELDPSERRSVESVLPIDELGSWMEEEPAGGDPSTPTAAFRPPTSDDLALLLYTSGTSGRSKGAMLSHGNVGAMIASLHEAWQWSERDVLLLSLPLFHLHGLVVGLLCALSAGATVRLEARFDAKRVVDRLAAGEATLFFGVPTLYVRLVEELRRRGGRQTFSDVRLFVSGSAPLAAEVHAAFRDLTGHAILERYGMTETGMLLSNPLHGERRAGTVGRALPGVELRLTDAAGQPLPAGVEGEVEVRGPNVFTGYWRAPEKSAASFRADDTGQHWFRTGDRGQIDPSDGYLTLLGRASELILSGGFNVYPREIEEVLARFPGVREAAVIGEPHAEFGESPAAFVVADGGLDLEALDTHCRQELAPFKLPRRYMVLDELPRNALGKVEKRRLLHSL